ncbi:MAG: ComF family protein [Marinilabiliaceae bacterium]
MMPNPFQKFIAGFSALLFPVICKGCGETAPVSGQVLCRSCEAGLPRTRFEKDAGNPVVQMFWGRTRLEFATSVFYYRKGELLQALIHQLKYKGSRETGTYLGEVAGKILNSTGLSKEADIMVPVPLHPRKEKTRGYNQSAILAGGISNVTGLPVLADAVTRTVHSDSQTRRGRYERWENVEGIFKVLHPDLLRDKHVLVLDDVVTTGATLEALCQELHKVPGIRLSVLTIGFAAG